MERLSTSGMIFESLEGGGLRVGYEDYGVGFFDGGDFECYYTLDKENTKRLAAALKADVEGLEKTLGEFVGEDFSSPKFEAFCKDNNIRYSQTTYRSNG